MRNTIVMSSHVKKSVYSLGKLGIGLNFWALMCAVFFHFQTQQTSTIVEVNGKDEQRNHYINGTFTHGDTIASSNKQQNICTEKKICYTHRRRRLRCGICIGRVQEREKKDIYTLVCFMMNI